MASVQPATTTKRPRKSTTGAINLAAADKRRRALELRLAGATLEQIAQQVGYKTRSGVSDAIKTALRLSLQEPAEELRAVESARYEQMLKVLWPRILRGELDAFPHVLRVMKQRAELLGLNEPVRVNIQALVMEIGRDAGMSSAEIRALADNVRGTLDDARASTASDVIDADFVTSD